MKELSKSMAFTWAIFYRAGILAVLNHFLLKKKEPYIQILRCSYCSCHTDNENNDDDDEEEEENGEANYLPPPIEECSQPGNLCPPPSPPPPPYLPLLTLSSKPWWLQPFKTLTAATTFFCWHIFDHLGPFWAHLGSFGSVQIKLDFLPQNRKVLLGQSDSTQYNFQSDFSIQILSPNSDL